MRREANEHTVKTSEGQIESINFQVRGDRDTHDSHLKAWEGNTLSSFRNDEWGHRQAALGQQGAAELV